MKYLIYISILILLSFNIFGQNTRTHRGSHQIYIEWDGGKPVGDIEVLNGSLTGIKITKGKGKAGKSSFDFFSPGHNRISIAFDDFNTNPGTGATLVTVNTRENHFSFFLRDVSKDFPIYIPEYDVVVFRADDNRSYSQIQTDIKDRRLQTKLQKILDKPEETYESASQHTRNSTNITLLGVSRDIRFFEISQRLEDISTSERGEKITAMYPYSRELQIEYLYNLGRGSYADLNIKRWLEEGVLPILHTTLIDEDIQYHSVSFASFENSTLFGNLNFGTDHLVADSYCLGTHINRQDESIKPKVQKFLNQSEETVLYFRAYAINTGNSPRYAWFRTAIPKNDFPPWSLSDAYDGKTGLFGFNDTIYCISKLNNNPLPIENISVLVKPGDTVAFEFYIPHKPISRERAIKLSQQSFDERYIDCKKFWKSKLEEAAQISLPEKRIEEMLRAGLLHLDLVTFGRNPDGPLAANVGYRYCPIGTESAPIIQFYNSMGWHDIARRSLMHFFEKQGEDGLMQNYFHYRGETGAILWSAGEYYRYTNDQQWVKEIEPKLLKACDYLLKWRERNKIDSLQGKGYGMIEGSMADPVDEYRQFMLNGYAYLGIKRVAEILAHVNPVQSARLKREAEFWKNDIRESFFNSVGYSPVIPISDGSWCPTVPPWPEAVGPRSLFGYSVLADAALGPLYLVFCEVLEPNEPASKMMLKYHSELFYQNNCAPSQPYYSRHDWIQLKLGMTKPFLKAYYNTFAAHADRETYTFREGFDHPQSYHKTHEEAWFLMQTRWMLYMEEGQILKLLSGIPRVWLEDGKVINVKNVASYYGTLSFNVKSNIKKGFIEATVDCKTDRKPKDILIRLPHPYRQKPVKVSGGVYDTKTETVHVKSFTGHAQIKVEY